MRFERLLERVEHFQVNTADMLGTQSGRWGDGQRAKTGRKACAIAGPARVELAGRRRGRICACWRFTRSDIRFSP
jgi:hypothetical protein